MAKELSRRSFIGASALGAMGLFGSAALAGCAPAASEQRTDAGASASTNTGTGTNAGAANAAGEPAWCR